MTNQEHNVQRPKHVGRTHLSHIIFIIVAVAICCLAIFGIVHHYEMMQPIRSNPTHPSTSKLKKVTPKKLPGEHTNSAKREQIMHQRNDNSQVAKIGQMGSKQHK